MDNGVMGNESAATFAWLSDLCGAGDDWSVGEAQALWNAVTKEMSGRKQMIVYGQEWTSDLWLARGTRIAGGMLGPKWDPPRSVAEWHGGGAAMMAATGLPGRMTNHAAFLKVLEEAALRTEDYDADALAEFMRWKGEITQQADVRMRQVEHVRAWLGTSVGHLLMSVALSPLNPAETEAMVGRLRLPLQYELPSSWANDFEERRLETLYNWRISAGGEVLQTKSRVGQGEEWREHWDWLSAEIAAEDALDAVRLAARLLRNAALGGILVACLTAADGYLQTVALAVLRRSLLTLKTMAWLEGALAHEWREVRPPDVVCFAFGALKPDWPTRQIAISHRSADVKPTLIEMEIWRSARCAIDANFIPAWETNTGMMWGLFAGPAAIARVDSPHYRDSVWCRREVELTEYLAVESDFKGDRAVLDVPFERLRELDKVTAVWKGEPGEDGTQGGLLSSFPPLCNAWSPARLRSCISQ